MQLSNDLHLENYSSLAGSNPPVLIHLTFTHSLHCAFCLMLIEIKATEDNPNPNPDNTWHKLLLISLTVLQGGSCGLLSVLGGGR